MVQIIYFWSTQGSFYWRPGMGRRNQSVRVADQSLGVGPWGGMEIGLQLRVPDQLWHLRVSAFVLIPTDSRGTSPMVWAVRGLPVMLGTMCCAELSTWVPESRGQRWCPLTSPLSVALSLPFLSPTRWCCQLCALLSMHSPLTLPAPHGPMPRAGQNIWCWSASHLCWGHSTRAQHPVLSCPTIRKSSSST